MRRALWVCLAATALACSGLVEPKPGPCYEAMTFTLRMEGSPDEIRRDAEAAHAGIPADRFVEYIYVLDGGGYRSQLFAWGGKIGFGCATRMATLP